MKIRSGFVSNSSSSSFVLYGIKIKDGDISHKELCKTYLNEIYIKEEKNVDVDWCDIWYENCYDSDYDIINCGYSGDLWIGELISEGGSGEMSIEDLLKMKITERKDCKIYYGTYGC